MIANSKEWLIRRLKSLKKGLDSKKHDHQDRIKLIDEVIEVLCKLK